MANAVSPNMVSLGDWLEIDAAGHDLPIRDIHLDSRQVANGDAFIALEGANTDGRKFVADAIAQGAVAVVVEAGASELHGLGVPVIAVPDLRQQLDRLAQRFYASATQKLQVIGVTGTNGKTSITLTLAQMLEQLDQRCAVVGTLGWGFAESLQDTGMTTPDVVSVHRLLARLAQQDARYVAMEVSSHGLDQGRVEQVRFCAAVFSNLSRDHLDYHGDMSQYEAAKRKLFLKDVALAVFNKDDAAGARLYRDDAICSAKLSYALADSSADIHCRDISYHSAGCSAQVFTPWGEVSLQSPLLGPFNLLNVLASVAVLGGLGFQLDRVVQAVRSVQGAPGRMQRIINRDFSVIVDYAHTPDALEQALKALRPHTKGQLRLVFGCGGNRDRGKRALMGAMAERLADDVVVTSDNPRDESPESIIEEVLAGFSSPAGVTRLVDRKAAINRALSSAGSGDVVLIAGKGHEQFQELRGERIPFSDAQCVTDFFAISNQADR